MTKSEYRRVPLVSVVIPTHNRTVQLKRAVESVLSQDHDRIELIVVDDNAPASTERRETQALLSSIQNTANYGKSVHYLPQPQTEGAAAARNRGAAVSNGQYIAFLDDDDIWAPEKTREQLEVFRSSPVQLGLVYTGLRVVDGSGAFLKYRPARYRGDIRAKLALRNVVGTTSSVLLPLAVFQEVGGFDPLFPARQDLDLWFRVAEEWSVDRVDKPLTVHVRHKGERITHQYDKKLEARIRFYAKYRDFFTTRRRLRSKYHFLTARFCMHHERSVLARHYLIKSLLSWPSTRAVKRLVDTFRKRANYEDIGEEA